tara:strand:- start:72 stop:353 length:282 start_codon:yes stop_codon:yes gene_type:complete
MEIKGKVINVKPVETVGANNFKKASIWVETTTEQYPQTIEIEFVKDKADEIQTIEVGSDVTVKINIRGRKWTGNDGVEKVFTSIQGWNVESNF